MKVFVSYRRDDSAAYSGRLREALVKRYGKKNVFQDLTAIPAGQDFNEASRHAAGTSDVLLAVIGNSWLTCSDAGGRRIDNPEDLVRREIGAALEKGVPVIPILVGGAKVPPEKDLPDELKPLSRRNAFEITDKRWESDISGLFREISQVTGKRDIPYKYLSVAALLILVLVISVWLRGFPMSWSYQIAVWELRSNDLATRISATRELERIANRSDELYRDAITHLAAFVRERAPLREGVPAKPPEKDVQAALTVLGRRRKSFEKGESERLDLNRIAVLDADLREAHLEGANLAGSDLVGANLWSAHLAKADLGGANLDQANLELADLTEAVLWASHLVPPIRVCSLREAVLTGAKFTDAELLGADLRGARGLTQQQLDSARRTEGAQLPSDLR